MNIGFKVGEGRKSNNLKSTVHGTPVGVLQTLNKNLGLSSRGRVK